MGLNSCSDSECCLDLSCLGCHCLNLLCYSTSCPGFNPSVLTSNFLVCFSIGHHQERWHFQIQPPLAQAEWHFGTDSATHFGHKPVTRACCAAMNISQRYYSCFTAHSLPFRNHSGSTVCFEWECSVGYKPNYRCASWSCSMLSVVPDLCSHLSFPRYNFEEPTYLARKIKTEAEFNFEIRACCLCLECSGTSPRLILPAGFAVARLSQRAYHHFGLSRHHCLLSEKPNGLQLFDHFMFNGSCARKMLKGKKLLHVVRAGSEHSARQQVH